MAAADSRSDFVMQTIQAQGRIRAYLLSLVLDKDRANDLLQQTNLVLLQKQSEYQPGSNFIAWAYRIAYFEVLADRRNRQRDRHLFNDAALAVIAARAEDVLDRHDEKSVALEDCLQQLKADQRDLLIARYRPGSSVEAMARSLGKTPAAISAALYRIRNSLLQCVERKLKGLTAL